MSIGIREIYYTVVLFSYACFADNALRSLDAQVNPGCPPEICLNTDDPNTITVVHISSDGENDTLHYVFDFTGKPSILIALTEPNTNLTINWQNFMDDEQNSIEFSTKPIYTSVAIMNRLWQFNDVEDTGTFSYGMNSSEINVYDTRNITWMKSQFHKSVHEVEVTVAGDNSYFFGDGKILIQMKCFASVDHGVDFPHLLHSENSTQFDLVLDGLRVNSTFKNARFAAEFVVVSEETKGNRQSFAVHSKKSLDDEHTPGIFEIVEIASPKSFMANEGSYTGHKGHVRTELGSKKILYLSVISNATYLVISAKGSFIQYRPVSYTHPERDVSTSTELHITVPTNLDNPAKQLNTSLAWVYYGYVLDEILVQGFNVSFGLPGDGFYTKTNYSTWTFIMGYGAPPNEQLSMFVVIVASIGLGIPLLLLVGGGCYICIKRTRNR